MSAAFDYRPDQPRHPKGDPKGGKFAPAGQTAPVSADEGNAHEPNKWIQQYLGHTSKFQREQSPDYPGKLPGEFQLEHGRGFIPDANTYRGRRGAQHGCYANAGKAALYDPDLTYVEGYVSVHGIPIAHAWNTDSAGRLIDPTLRSGAARDGAGYWGVPIKTSYLRETIMRKRTWGVLQYDNAENYLSDPPEKIVKKRLDTFDEDIDDDWRDLPRIPKGRSGGGRWTKGSGETTPALKSKGDKPERSKGEEEREEEGSKREGFKKFFGKEKPAEEEPEKKAKGKKPKREKVKKEGREIGEIEGSGKRWEAHPKHGGESMVFSSHNLAALYLIQMAARFVKRHASIKRDGIDDHTPGGHEHDQKKHGHRGGEHQKHLPFEPELHKHRDPNPREPETERKKKLKDKLQQQFKLEGYVGYNEKVEDKIVDLWDKHIKMEPEEFANGMIGEKLALDNSLELTLRTDGRLNVDGYFKGGGHLSYVFDFERKSVYLDLIAVSKAQPKGSTKSMMGANIETYEKLGIEHVKLYANIKDGGYAWARYGFTPTSAPTIYENVRSRAHGLFQDNLMSSSEYQEIRRLASGSNPKTIWDIAAHPRGKDLLLSNSWDGELFMSDRAQVDRLKRYVGK